MLNVVGDVHELSDVIITSCSLFDSSRFEPFPADPLKPFEVEVEGFLQHRDSCAVTSVTFREMLLDYFFAYLWGLGLKAGGGA